MIVAEITLEIEKALKEIGVVLWHCVEKVHFIN